MKSSSFPTATIPASRLLPGIHGLRGLAAVAVILFHVVHIVNIPAPDEFSFIATDFGKGVHLFFVLSAFSLMHSTEHTMARPEWVREYFVKRFFRIAPLYYLLMTAMILWPFLLSGTWQFDLETILLNATFTFGFAPWTGIVWAGWSVGVEMLFYAIFPVLLMSIRSRFGTLILVIFSVIVTCAARNALQDHYEHTTQIYRYNWAYFSFAANACFFAIGMYAYRITTTVDRHSPVMRWIIPSAALAILGALLLTDVGKALRALENSDLVAWGLGFAALSAWQATKPSQWSANRLMHYLGERSYSLYLLHPVVTVLVKTRAQELFQAMQLQLGDYAFFMIAALILAIVLTLAEATYRLVEIPFITFSRKVTMITRLRTA